MGMWIQRTRECDYDDELLFKLEGETTSGCKSNR